MKKNVKIHFKQLYVAKDQKRNKDLKLAAK